MQESDARSKQKKTSPKKVLIGVGLSLLTTVGLSSVLLNVYHQKRLTECKANLSELGKAMERYSSDSDGHYPTQLEKLAPKYIAVIPTCPNHNGRYQLMVGPDAPGNEPHFDDYFYLFCEGQNHAGAGLGRDLPAFDPLGRPREPEF